MKNLLVGLLIVAAFIGGYFFSQKYNFRLESKVKEQPAISPTSQPSPTSTIDEAENLETIIKQLLIEKHGSSANNLTITVSKKSNDYAKGGASEQGGGAMWLAAKENGKWIIVFEGNGAPDCQSIKTNYKFPTDMLVNVCD